MSSRSNEVALTNSITSSARSNCGTVIPSEARASVCTAATLQEALRLAEEPGLALAIIDLALGRETTLSVCNRLAERSLPFVIYSGYSEIPPECKPQAVCDRISLGGRSL